MNPFSKDYKPVFTITKQERAAASVSRKMAVRNQMILDKHGPTTLPTREQKTQDWVKSERIKHVAI